MTKLISVNASSPDPQLIEAAARALRAGEIVMVPTETRYGLMVRADDPKALERLYWLKGRSFDMPTALFVKSNAEIRAYAATGALSDALAEEFLPGPLTLVLGARTELEAPVVVDGKIGFRVSSLPFIRELVSAVSFPLTATSANRSGDKEFTTAAEGRAVFGEAVDLYFEAGELTNEVSTVVDCSGSEAKILREGTVTTVAIRKITQQLKTCGDR